jgi:myosin heavy subunit
MSGLLLILQWKATHAAMDTMGFLGVDQDAIFTALAGLLHLGVCL